MKTLLLKLIGLSCILCFFTNCLTKTAEEYYRMGTWNDTLGNHKKAVKAYSLAIKKDPYKSIYYVRRGNSKSVYYGLIHNSKSILADYSKAMNVDPWNEEGCYALGSYFYRKEDYYHSLVYLDTLLRKNPKHSEGYLLRGKLYYDKKDTATGNYNFRKAVEYSNDKKKIFLEIATVQDEQKYYYDALVNYNRSLHLSDKVKFCCYASLSYCYWKVNKRDSACYYYDLISDKSMMLGDYADIKYFCERK